MYKLLWLLWYNFKKILWFILASPAVFCSIYHALHCDSW